MLEKVFLLLVFTAWSVSGQGCSSAGCISCPTNPSTCQQCNTGYYLANSACIKCTNSFCATCVNVASNCTGCNSGYFASGGTCYACLTCTAGVTYQTTACGPSTNRVCTTCTTCLSGQYAVSNCTITADRTCTACSACGVGQYVSTACSANANTQCTTASCPSNSGGSPCTCNTGYYGNLTWSTGNNFWTGQCNPCPANCDSCVGATSCLQCREGRFWTGTTCAAQACSVNASGVPCTCLPGYNGTLTWNYTTLAYMGSCTLAPCPANAAGEPECSCVNGYYGPILWNKGAWEGSCQACQTCDFGYYETIPCTPNYDRACAECSFCASTQYESSPCTSTSNRGCVDCARFCVNCNATACNQCQTGFYLSAGTCVACTATCSGSSYESTMCTTSTNRVCTPCTTCITGVSWASSSCTSTSNRVCTACTNCTIGQFMSSPCTVLSNRVCSACSSNCAVCTNAMTCTTCNRGFFVHNGFCQPCLANCAVCAGTASCSTCNIGYFVYGQTCAIVPCPANSSDAPNCACAKGYSGLTIWNAGTTSWSGNCTLLPCPANAVNPPNCTCQNGYAPNISWDDVQRKWSGDCTLRSCPANSYGAPNCICEPGFYGTLTWNQQNSNWMGTCSACPGECTSCSNISDCDSCGVGYELIDGRTCNNIDECSLSISPCQENSYCVDTAGSFSCTCFSGFSDEKGTCVDVDECAGGKGCQEYAVCVNLPGTYKCECIPGYYFREKDVCANIDECEKLPCDNGLGLCLDTEGSYWCFPYLEEDSLSGGTVQSVVSKTLDISGIVTETKFNERFVPFTGTDLTFRLISPEPRIIITDLPSIIIADENFNTIGTCSDFDLPLNETSNGGEIYSSRTFFQNSTLRCHVPPGCGGHYRIGLIYTSQIRGSMILWNTGIEPKSQFWNYPFATFTPNTLRFDGKEPAVGGIGLETNTQSAVVVIDGDNFCSSSNSPLTVTMGYGEYPDFEIISTNQTTLMFTIPVLPSEVLGQNFPIQVKIGNAPTAYSEDEVVYRVGPEVLNVTGCDNSTNPPKCNTTGGQVVIYAIRINKQVSDVKFNQYTCIPNSLTQINPNGTSRIVCILRPGVGTDLILTIYTGNVLAIKSSALSYYGPIVEAIYGTNCISSSGNSRLLCPRNGTLLTLVGRNFGPLGTRTAVVFVGRYVCEDPVVTVEHTRITCKMPQGRGADHRISMLQGGSLSQEDMQFSYQTCVLGWVPDLDYSNATDPYFLPCRACTPGSYSDVRSEDAKCKSCAVGSFSSQTGAGNCSICGFGFESNENFSGCLPCQPGFAKSRFDVVCVECDIGRYQPSSNASDCLSPPSGTYVDVTGSRTVSGCPAGNYAADNTKCIPCSPGRYQPNANSTQCLPCEPTTVANGTGLLECRACPSGYFESNRTDCLPCETGRYRNASISSGCIPCEPGLVAKEPAAEFCDICNAGYYENNRVECLACPKGKYRNNLNTNECSFCDPGLVAIQEASTECVLCPSGNYGFNNTICLECNKGSYNNGSFFACKPCPAGYDAQKLGATDCDPCNPGYYNDGTLEFCTNCPDGRYASENASHNCTVCPDGKTSTIRGDQCESCAIGRYSTHGAACLACPGGSYYPNISGTACIECAGGSTEYKGACQCPSDTYLEVGQNISFCRSCPVGASCGGKLLSEITSLPGYQQSPSSPLLFYPCTIPKYCTSGGCAGEREGPLCGTCKTGYYEWGGKCVACDRYGLLILFLFISWIYVIIIHLISQNSTSDDSKILFFFVSTAKFIISGRYAWLNFINLLSYDPDQGGVCLAPFTPYQKITFQLFLPLIMLFQLGVTSVIHYLYRKYSASSPALPDNKFFNPYIRSVFALGVFSYTHLSDITLRYLDCEHVDVYYIVKTIPSINCYSSLYKNYLAIVILFLIFPVISYPIVLGVILYKKKEQLYDRSVDPPALGTISQKIGIIYEAYTPKKYWWGVVSLLRRSGIVVISVIAKDRLQLTQAYAVFCVLIMTLHVASRPFANRMDNVHEMISLMGLALISILQTGDSDIVSLHVQVINSLIIVAVLAWLIITVIRNRVHKVMRKIDGRTVEIMSMSASRPAASSLAVVPDTPMPDETRD